MIRSHILYPFALLVPRTGLVAHRVEVVAQSAGGRQFQPQMLKPKFERHRLLKQQLSVLVFAATVENAQHQENIDDIGFGAGPAYLQFDLIELELTQLKLQFGQIRRLARQELRVEQAQQLFLFGVQIQVLVDALHDGGLKAGDLVNFAQKIVQLAVNRGQED